MRRPGRRQGAPTWRPARKTCGRCPRTRSCRKMSRHERQFPRYALAAEIEIRPHGAGTARRGRTSNLSRGGLCALIDAAIPTGRTVDVQIALVFAEGSFSEPLVLGARVVWCTQLGAAYQVGVSF